MSSSEQILLKKTSPRIYSNSLTFNEPTQQDKPLGAFFKLFLINNKLSLPTHPHNIVWGTTNPRYLHEDVDTFIGTYLTEKDEEGNHPSLREAGIFETNYSNKADYVKAAIDFFKDHGVAKIVDVYKPDNNMLAAAEKDPNQTLIYEAMAYTENQDLINKIQDMKTKNEDIYVSPGVYVLDSHVSPKNEIIVNRFIGTHSSIVDHPAHTKPVAFVKKEICNNDHKTCYYKLLTASEMLKLNNNNSENKTMAQQVNIPSADIGAPDPTAVTSRTEVKDASGKVVEVIDTNPKTQQQEIKKEVTTAKEQAIEQVKKEVEDGKQEVEKKVKEEEKSIDKLTKAELLETLKTWKQDTIKEIEAKTEQKYRQQRKHEILNTYIPANNDSLKTEYEFYKTLPITPDQLQTILVNSKFNPEIQKALANNKSVKPFASPNGNDKPDNMHTAGASNPAITSNRVQTTTYNDANTGFGNGQTSLRHLTSGKNIPKKFL